MRRLIACAVVVALCCLSAAPVAEASSTFTADLAVYRARNTTTSDAARDLSSLVGVERRFVRTVKGTSAPFRVLLHTYQVALDQTESMVRRIVRDQRTSDHLLADITALDREGRRDAASVLLRRGLAGQDRFLVTIARARNLMEKCKNLHTQLLRAST